MLPTKPGSPLTAIALMALLTGVFAALLTALASAPAQAYPADTCSINLSSQVVTSGKTLQVSGSASSRRHWKISWHGVTRDRTGSSFAVSFTAPGVTKPTVFRMHIRSTVVAPGATASTVAGCSRTLNVTVRPAGGTAVEGTNATSGAAANDPGSELPNTGGPSLLWPLLGLALLLVGGVAAMLGSRREDESGQDAERSN